MDGSDEMRARTDGASPPLPRWNWGAFFLNWIWGIGNGVPLALLSLIPGLNFIMPFVLGARGYAWAWRTGRWSDVAEFRRNQRVWGWVGFGIWAGAGVIGGLVAMIFAIVFFALMHSGPYRMAVTRVRHSGQCVALLGTPIHAGIPLGNVNETDGSGWAHLHFRVHGPRDGGWVDVRAERENGRWRLTDLELQLDDQAQPIKLTPPIQTRLQRRVPRRELVAALPAPA